jgi:starvation-inducible DNA-binding protein
MSNTASINANAKVSVEKALQETLADSFMVYFKTHSFHWNVEGAHFHSLHGMFEEQYNEIWVALDDIAERLRALDAYAPLNFAELAKHASISETGQMPDATSMVKMLAEDNAALVAQMQGAVIIAQEAGDEATADLLITRIAAHEKAAWMLKSTAK